VCSGAAETFSLSESTGCKPKGKHQARFNKKIGFHGILLKKNPVLTSNPKLYPFSLIWNSIHINGVVVKNNTELAFLCKKCGFGVVFYNNAIYMGAIPNWTKWI
jgi:hypothetical protein